MVQSRFGGYVGDTVLASMASHSAAVDRQGNYTSKLRSSRSADSRYSRSASSQRSGGRAYPSARSPDRASRRDSRGSRWRALNPAVDHSDPLQ